MTITCDSLTRSSLDGAVSKADWASRLGTALGLTGRRVVCKRDANASTSDVWANGTTFRNVGSTGTFASVGGKIVSLGTLRGTSVSLAATMATGKSVLRMTSADGSRWIQGTLGLSRKAQAALGIAEESIVDYDFTVAKDFTSTNGLGVTPNFSIGGKRFLPSGVGPAAPSLDDGAPTVFEMWDWSNPNSPVKTGTINLDKRVEDFVYEDSEMALMNGDTAVYQSTQQLTLGEFAFGFTLLAAHSSNTEVGNVPLYQVLGAIRSIKPSWSSYPASDTYDKTNDNTFPAPFKVVAKNSAGTVIHTFELHDGKAINDPTVTTAKQDWQQGLRPVRPMVDCYTMLPWQNTRPRASTKLKKFYPGLDMTKFRPSMGKAHFSVNGIEALTTGGYSNDNTINGYANIYTMLQWPQVHNFTYGGNPWDPYMSQIALNHPTQQGSPWVQGYAYEPGSFSGHNWYTGPGGVRFDRAFMPAIFALWATDPTGHRLMDNTPWRDMLDGHLFGSFNHRNHWVRDVKAMTFTPFSEFKNGQWGGNLEEYYSSGTEVPGPYTIRGNSSQRDGTHPWNFDKNGNMPMCGWGRDGQHNYANAGWGALLLNSPMHAIGARWDFLYMLQSNGNPDRMWGGYMYRNQAWQWLALTLQWKLASRHTLGVNRTDIEEIFCRQLEAIYREIYVPAFVENRTEPTPTGIRNLGNPIGGSPYSKYATQGGWGYFMAGVLMLMKQTGLWSKLRAKGGHVQTALEMQLRNMDKNCFDGLLDTTGQYWSGIGLNDIPASLAAWSAQNEAGATYDLIHDASGNLIGDREFGQWPMTQYVYIRRDFFPEIASPRLSAAVTKMDSYLAIRAAAVAAQTDPQNKMGIDSIYALPGVFPIAAPTELGPA